MALTANMDKEVPDERVLKVEKIPGEHTLSSSGTVANSLFKGDNPLYAYKGKDGLGWYLRYKSGELPEPLKQCFTTFPILFKFVESYFRRRGLRLYEEMNP
jgi:hypothetical protein